MRCIVFDSANASVADFHLQRDPGPLTAVVAYEDVTINGDDGEVDTWRTWCIQVLDPFDRVVHTEVLAEEPTVVQSFEVRRFGLTSARLSSAVPSEVKRVKRHLALIEGGAR